MLTTMESMPTRQVKNVDLVPHIATEGVFTKPINLPATEKYGLSTYPRLFSHHTLSSIRKYVYYRAAQAPKDSLDFVLTSTYNHSYESFPEKVDVFVQPETKGMLTWRRLRNTTDVADSSITSLKHPATSKLFGGITERRSPNNVKLMNSGCHSAQTNPGYSRQASGGMMYFY